MGLLGLSPLLQEEKQTIKKERGKSEGCLGLISGCINYKGTHKQTTKQTNKQRGQK